MICNCGHDKLEHEHFAGGTNCTRCACTHFHTEGTPGEERTDELHRSAPITWSEEAELVIINLGNRRFKIVKDRFGEKAQYLSASSLVGRLERLGPWTRILWINQEKTQ